MDIFKQKLKHDAMMTRTGASFYAECFSCLVILRTCSRSHQARAWRVGNGFASEIIRFIITAPPFRRLKCSNPSNRHCWRVLINCLKLILLNRMASRRRNHSIGQRRNAVWSMLLKTAHQNPRFVHPLPSMRLGNLWWWSETRVSNMRHEKMLLRG